MDSYLEILDEPIIHLRNAKENEWHAPKFLVKSKMGLSYSHSGIVRNSRHTPNSQH
jgi:hypothetical protein